MRQVNVRTNFSTNLTHKPYNCNETVPIHQKHECRKIILKTVRIEIIYNS